MALPATACHISLLLTALPFGYCPLPLPLAAYQLRNVTLPLPLAALPVTARHFPISSFTSFIFKIVWLAISDRHFTVSLMRVGCHQTTLLLIHHKMQTSQIIRFFFLRPQQNVAYQPTLQKDLCFIFASTPHFQADVVNFKFLSLSYWRSTLQLPPPSLPLFVHSRLNYCDSLYRLFPGTQLKHLQ